MPTIVALLRPEWQLTHRRKGVGTNPVIAGFAPIFPDSLGSAAKDIENASTLSRLWSCNADSESEARVLLEKIQSKIQSGQFSSLVEQVYLAPRRAPLIRTPSWQQPGPPSNSELYWWHYAIGCNAARDIPGYKDGADITVSVVDTGVDETHVALAAAVAAKENFTMQVDTDEVGHGTHVCGILAGRSTRHRDREFHGVSGAQLYVAKALVEPHETESYYRALDSASRRGRVMNLSLGGPDMDPGEATLIRMTIEERNVAVVSAMGNDFDFGNPVTYPAALDGVIAVGASDIQGNRASFSGTGSYIYIVAPGVDIWSTHPEGWAAIIGTSMAAPMVAGTVALMLSKESSLTQGDIRNVLKSSAKSNRNGFCEELGWGILDTRRALELC